MLPQEPRVALGGLAGASEQQLALVLPQQAHALQGLAELEDRDREVLAVPLADPVAGRRYDGSGGLDVARLQVAGGRQRDPVTGSTVQEPLVGSEVRPEGVLVGDLGCADGQGACDQVTADRRPGEVG